MQYVIIGIIGAAAAIALSVLLSRWDMKRHNANSKDEHKDQRPK